MSQKPSSLDVTNLPLAVDDTAATDATHGVWLNLAGNDTDPYGDVLTVSQLGTGFTLGSVAMNPSAVNGAWYVPAAAMAALSAGETATDRFTYTVSDAHGGSAQGTATVTVAGVNQAPVALADTATTNATHAVQIVVLSNDTDVNRDDVLSVGSLDTTGTLGSVHLGPGGIVTYTPGPGFGGLVAGTATTDSFAYTVSDGHGGSSRAVVTVKVTAPGAAALAPTALYVATDGNDAWSGRLAAPNAAGTDGPLASLQAAQAKMETGTTRTTYVEGGSYTLTSSLALTAADSGQSWLAYPGQTPTINGGQRVTGWTRGANGLWTAPAPAGAFALGGGVADLFVNGVRQIHARYPDAVPTMPVKGGWLAVQPSLAGENTYSSFQYSPGSVPALSAGGLYAAIYQQNGWQEYTLPVASINTATDTITLAGSTFQPIDAGSRFYLYNAASLLNTPNEWFYNTASNTITYDAPAGFTGAGVTVGSLHDIVSISGADGINISGLTLAGSASSGNGVSVTNSTGVTLAGDTIENVGNGVTFNGTGSGDRIEGSLIAGTDNDGILINPGTNNVTVTGNKIHDIGQLLNGSAVWFTGSSNDSFTYNTVQNVARVGIGGGSAIGLSDASYNDAISYNKIGNTNMATSDGGAIIIGGMQQTATGDTVSYNEVSGTGAAGTSAASKVPSFLPTSQLTSYGIYLDDFASGVTVKGNMLHDNLGGILVHSGSDNLVTNNIIANSAGMATIFQADNWRGAGAAAPSGNLFTGNLIANSTPGAALAVSLGSPGEAQWSRNFYASSGTFGTAFISDNGGNLQYSDFSGWQAQSYDPGSLVGNPGLSDSGSLSLAADSAARALGLSSTPASSIGVSGFTQASHYDLFGHVQ